MIILRGLFVSFLFFGAHAIFSFVYADVEKTLVSWVMMQDRKIKAGSILTLQEENKFDGIIFAEKMDDKWMAGSDNWTRSENNQEKYPDWDAEMGSLVQMAIVYQKELISIFRDGTPTAEFVSSVLPKLITAQTSSVDGLMTL